MPDFDAITVAIAGRFDPANVTPPTGYGNIRESITEPNQLGPLPVVVVFPETGAFEYGPGKRDSVHTFLVRFYYGQIIHLERDSVALRKWLTVLVGQLQGAVQLGGIVTSARVSGWAIGALNFAGQPYSGIELTVDVNVNEGWSAVA